MNKDRFQFVMRYAAPAPLGYLVMAGAGLLVYFFLMTSRGGDILAIIAILFALLGLFAKMTGAPIILLLLTTYALLDPGFFSVTNFIGTGQWSSFVFDGGYSIEDGLLAMAVLAYLVGHYRLNALLREAMPKDPSVRREVFMPEPVSRPLTQVGPEELPRILIVGGVCVIVGQLGWLAVTLAERAMRPHTLTTGSGRAMALLWGLGSLLMIASAVLTYLRMSRMTPAEASMVVRDEAFHETRRETDRVERWRKWFKAKMSRKRAGR